MNLGTKTSQLEFEIKKVDLLYRQNVAGMIAIFVNTGAFVFYAWSSAPFIFLITWFLALNFSTIIRYFAFYFWRSARTTLRNQQDLKKWRLIIYSCLLVSGLGWGFLGFLTALAPAREQVLAGLIVASMCAGAMITYVSSPIAMMCVIVPSMMLWALGHFSTESSLDKIMGGLILFYCLMMVLIGRNLYSTIMRSMMLDVRLKENEERLRMAMESSGSLTWDWNLVDQDFYWEGNTELFPQGQGQLRAIIAPFVQTRTDIDHEHVIKDEKGRYRYIAIRGRFHQDAFGVYSRFVGICWDVTAKKNEEFLRQERDLHEAENRAKSVLLANASHEMRTPLAAIIGFAEAILRSPTLSAQHRRDVQGISRQGHYMTSLINDLLDLSKVESNRLYLQSTAMNPAYEIEECVSALGEKLKEKNLNIEIEYETQVPLEIQADPARFRQVMMNVLNNAVNFSQEGPIRVSVSLGIDATNQATFKIQIADKGIGIDPETQAHLFEPFARGDAEEVQRTQGSGLGLPLSSSLMKMMNGELKLLHSELHEGSTFELIFHLGPANRLNIGMVPTKKSKSSSKLKIINEGAFLKGRRVLVVDDSVDLRLLMRRYLNKQGASVETSENGKEAVETAMKDPFDIILMDIKMPVMDGYEATAKLRESGYRKPIVALTAQASVDGQKKSVEMGFDGYLSKPVDMGMLKEILKDKAEFA
ncbi:hybrid sensor histidine kinase/response regulator [Bdellovibrio bacteriovorus]|uniref:histidine kinase n=1 Tax=Bdellovibrio bacteriovorus TaxID=959 RepID=A0A150WRB5_BDEBC|nr:response regulator [Bdellovibrio bacteriovorus]KYG66847.1 hybrid sensor histidine kinase/response regulator [Bdellovibrio bacteriovorus]